MQCRAVSVECLLLYPCCVVMCGMLSVMNGKSAFSNFLANADVTARVKITDLFFYQS